MKVAKKLYLAYGSNLNISQMRARCPGAEIAGTAVIEDHHLLFKGSKTGAYLTIEPQEGSRVPVGVWSVTEADERNLDRYEGCDIFYSKREMELPVKDILSGEVRTETGFVYIMRQDRALGLPSNDYFMVCAHGYQSFGFDTQLLLDAYADSRKEDALWKAIW